MAERPAPGRPSEGAAAVTGWFGVLPRRAGFIGRGVPPEVSARWDRWFELAAARTPPGPLHLSRPSWRIAARAGVFGPAPLAGVWRLSRDAAGRIYPFAVLRSGPLPAIGDPWYDRAGAVATEATDGTLTPTDIDRAVALLPPPAEGAAPQEAAVLLWRDDWEVRELSFATPSDFAAHGLPSSDPDLGAEPGEDAA